MLDTKICHSIDTLIEKLSTTGKDVLDMVMLKELFIQAGKSEEYLRFFHGRLIQQLEKEHSEIRFGVFLIIDNIFIRSEYFRGLLLEDFEDFLDLVVESNPSKPLPRPYPAAKKLKQKALQNIQKWYQQFGHSDNRLEMGYQFLKRNLKVDFEDAEKRTAVEIVRARQKEERQAKIVQSRIEALRVEVDENAEEISRIITEMDNCCGLLIPSLDNFLHAENDCNNESQNSNEEKEFDMREHGLGGIGSTINIKIPIPNARVQRTDDNEAIIQNLKDLYSLCKNRFLPRAKKWVQMVSKAEDQDLFKRVMSMKEMIQSEMSRFEELSLVSRRDNGDSDSESTDSDFEEVPDKDGYEEFVKEPPILPPPPKISKTPTKSSQSWSDESWSLGENNKDMDTDNTEAQDPTTIKATLADLMKKQRERQRVQASSSLSPNNSQEFKEHIGTGGTPEPKPGCSKWNSGDGKVGKSSLSVQEGNEESSMSRKEKLLQKAPKLPFDIDLYHWEEENLKAPSIEVAETSSHRFWQPSDRVGDVIEAQEGVAALRTRTIEFTGKFEPVKWKCRAPLKSGKLCPRRDRIKCPFHGNIIPRDEEGNPTEPDDIARLEKEKAKEELEKPPDWQDPEYLKELKAQIGIDLTIKPPKKGRKRKTFAELYPGLTDIEKEKKSSRARLKKKIFNRSSIDRVAQDMDDITYKRFRDKFGDQFNYVHETS